MTEPADIMVKLIIIQLLIGLLGVHDNQRLVICSPQLEEQLAISRSTMHVTDKGRHGGWRATGRSQRGDAKTLHTDNEYPLQSAIDALGRLWIRSNS